MSMWAQVTPSLSLTNLSQSKDVSEINIMFLYLYEIKIYMLSPFFMSMDVLEINKI